MVDVNNIKWLHRELADLRLRLSNAVMSNTNNIIAEQESTTEEKEALNKAFITLQKLNQIQL